MKKLFEFCGREENCEDEEFRSIYEKKMLEGKNFSSLSEEEIRRLNELCKKCNHLLETEEKKCPVCGNENLQGSPLVSFHEKQKWPLPITSFESGGLTHYFYRCENKACGRLLYSHKTF